VFTKGAPPSPKMDNRDVGVPLEPVLFFKFWFVYTYHVVSTDNRGGSGWVLGEIVEKGQDQY
jgi:hypothetical protein